MVDAVVIGAGIAGLAAASELRSAGLEVQVCEAADRPGGVIRSERHAGHLFERGPNTFRASAAVGDWLGARGLEGRLLRAGPASRERFLLREGRLTPVPMGPFAFARSPLLSGRAKRRLLREPFVAQGDATGESVAEFASRRLGPEVSERLVAAFLVGIYAGDERQLGAEAVFPTLVAYERSHGSIVRGALAQALRRDGASGRSGSFTTADGMEGLVAPLAEALGPRLQLSTRVVGLQRDGEAWVLETEGPVGQESLRARGLLLATPAPEASQLLGKLDTEAAGLLASISYAPIVSLSVGVDPGGAAQAIRGFGFLVPREEGERLLGCLFMSQLFPGRAPEGRELLTCMYGGVAGPQVLEEPDEALALGAREDLERILGLRGEIRVLGITRWPRAVPQPDREHPRRIAAVRGRLGLLPPVGLAGSYLEGVSVADTAVCGAAAGRELAARLRAGRA